VLDEPAVRELLVKVFRERAVGDKQKRRLNEYAAFHDEPELASYLAQEAGLGVAQFGVVQGFEQQRSALNRKYLAPYAARNFKDVLRQCDTHGTDHRTPMNQTPLMAAAAAGNAALVEALLERGADRDATDQYGCNALHIALREAFRDRGSRAALRRALRASGAGARGREGWRAAGAHRQASIRVSSVPDVLDAVQVTLHTDRSHAQLCTRHEAILQAWEGLPENVLRAARNKRQHLSHVLSRNEVERDYAYNRALFNRVAHGWYQFNPTLEVRCRSGAGEESWQPVFAALNLPLIGQFSTPYSRSSLSGYLTSAGMPACPVPIMAEREAARLEEEARRQQEELRRQEAQRLARENRERRTARAARAPASAADRASGDRREAAPGHAGSAFGRHDGAAAPDRQIARTKKAQE
jgi:hypothetical protein